MLNIPENLNLYDIIKYTMSLKQLHSFNRNVTELIWKLMLKLGPFIPPTLDLISLSSNSFKY